MKNTLLTFYIIFLVISASVPFALAMVFYCVSAGLYLLWGAWNKRWRTFDGNAVTELASVS
jgi:hypothetical protein